MLRIYGSALIALVVGISSLQAQSIELKPGSIQGTVSIANSTVNNLRVRATWDVQSSDASFGGNTTYALTVNVPPGATPSYVVKPYISMDDGVDYLELPSQTVLVRENEASTLDFTPALAFVEGTVTVRNGTLATASFSAGADPWLWKATTTTSAARGGRFLFPVLAGANVEVRGRVQLGNGAWIDVETRVFDSLEPGEIAIVDVDVTAPAANGLLRGTVNVVGPRAPSVKQVVVDGRVNKSGVASNVTGAYEVSGLPDGDYDVWAETYYDQNRTYFRSPHRGAATGNPLVHLSSSMVARDFTFDEAFISGTLSLTGSRGMSDVDWAIVYASGVSGSPTEGGAAYHALTPPGGDFEFIVSPGTWRMDGWTYLHFAPRGWQHGYLYILDKQNGRAPITVGAGETARPHVSYETGTATFVLGTSRGLTFSAPRVEAVCSDIVDGVERTYWEAYIYGSQSNVTEAPMTLVGINGRCSVRAYARLAGEPGETSFGELTLDIVAGVDQTFGVGEDNTAPVIAVPADIVREAASAAGAVVTYSVSAADTVERPVPVSCSVPSGSLFPVGTTVVACAAQDSKGNVNQASFRVTVRDTTAPTLGTITASRTYLWPVNHALVDVALAYTVTDAVSAPSCTVSVASNEPPPAVGQGKTSTDWVVVDSRLVRLRAERSGLGSGRVYTITVTCVDAAGNASSRTTSVPVLKSRPGQ